MKKLVILFLAALPIVACNQAEKNEKDKNENQEMQDTTSLQEDGDSVTGTYGASITDDNAIPVSELLAKLENQDSVETKVVGTIGEVCQMKGCWMTMPAGDKEMRISFKDYGFFVPKNASGYEVVMEGKAKRQVITVDELKHYAQDAGKSEEEIAAITEPEESLVFVADGVIIR